MCQVNPSVNDRVPTGRFLNKRAQRKLKDRTLVPVSLRCPRCRHRFDIVISRQQLHQNWLARTMVRHYRCRVCECRFRHWNRTAVQACLRAAFLTALFLVMAFVPFWTI